MFLLHHLGLLFSEKVERSLKQYPIVTVNFGKINLIIIFCVGQCHNWYKMYIELEVFFILNDNICLVSHNCHNQVVFLHCSFLTDYGFVLRMSHTKYCWGDELSILCLSVFHNPVYL